ncbi:MAG: hypothetical protein GY839_00790 [candidate division Zixibacteria bacterium]|nr:hypothetical protein [candidate division Zixibacteria bacterium]
MRQAIISLLVFVFVITVTVKAQDSTYEYLPGDCNMSYGSWPPAANATDVSYLVRYFRLFSGYDLCYKYNPEAPSPPDTLFYASADVNGDCKITGGDIVYFVCYFRAIGTSLQYCPYYPPEWLTIDDIPPYPPDNWPNCHEPPAAEYIEPFVSSPYPIVTFWIGDPDSLSIPAEVGQVFPVNVYVQTFEGAYGGDIHVPLGIDNQYIQGFEDSAVAYYPLTDWDVIDFLESQGSPPNPSGWSSRSLVGWAEVISYDAPFINSTMPHKLMTFYVRAVSDTSMSGNIVNCLDVGGHPSYWTLDIGDTLGLGSFPAAVYVLPVRFGRSQLEYLPGDANMSNGIWPPAVIGADVTYMVNYFRALSESCLLEGFYCSADINGDCLVIGSDVTRLVNYFRGDAGISWCPDYESAWPIPDDLPIDAPVGWPNCEVPVAGSRTIPNGAGK